MTASVPPPTGDPPSPCIGICVINPHTQLCDGCARTLNEIAGWRDYPPDQKQMILAELENRLAQIADSVWSFDS